MKVRIDRQRLKAKDPSPKPPTNKKLREAAHQAQLETQIRTAVRRSYGSQELDLKSLELVHIPRAAVFTTLLLQLARTIRTVNVSRNALRELPDTFVQAFPEVETLIYKENALARLPSQALGELRYLRVLNVSGNQLDRLPLELPETLETLDASRNRLQEIQNLHLLTKLVTLDVSYNHFQLLPCGLVALHKLQTLIVAGNRLSFSSLPPALDRWDGVDYLHSLVLSGNELLELPPSIGKLKRLKRLEAENNKLLALPDVLQGLTALETLKLGMNGLVALPPSFSKLQNLTEADFKLNRLEQLPEALGDLQQLRVLDVSSNALKTLPKSFLALKRIVTLRISGNTPLLAS
eukprot:jgi/Phyca11/98760/e_gw1.3.118.1